MRNDLKRWRANKGKELGDGEEVEVGGDGRTCKNGIGPQMKRSPFAAHTHIAQR